jgi:hypothetical protein
MRAPLQNNFFVAELWVHVAVQVVPFGMIPPLAEMKPAQLGTVAAEHSGATHPGRVHSVIVESAINDPVNPLQNAPFRLPPAVNGACALTAV